MADPNPPLWFRIVVYPFIMVAYAFIMCIDWVFGSKK